MEEEREIVRGGGREREGGRQAGRQAWREGGREGGRKESEGGRKRERSVIEMGSKK